MSIRTSSSASSDVPTESPRDHSGAGVADTDTPDLAGSRFGRIRRLAGGSFFTIAFLARLPLAMLTVGALTLVTAASGSYATGGFAAGAVGIGSAIGAPVVGFLADRLGQRGVLLTTAVLNPLAIAATLLGAAALEPDTAPWAVLAACLLMGASTPQVGPMARVRWMALTSRRGSAQDLDTALSYEGTADELTFVLGPALVGLLASVVAPWLPLALAALLTASMVTAFALHPTAGVVNAGRSGKAAPAPLSLRTGATVAVPVLGMLAIGTFFGSMQTSLTAFSGSFGMTSAAGLLYAVMGLSSAAAALSVAYWPARIGPVARWLLSSAGMFALVWLVLLPADVPTMVVALFVLGIPVGPTMVSIFAVGSVVAPRHLVGTVMTLLASGTVAGTALGSALAGPLAEAHGHGASLLVPAGAATAMLLLSLAAHLVLRRTARS
ncbi:Major Facilitator Superfamily protein [Arthrobacter saudimassiliensis]|uniref:Major Facilitator Superfamily protein n=1 Tax=Arthrobacter saudimassiliensis TaxID=1461584 RepID=A0A078MSZ0_9MICC|nr:Major Facilitator Superfamily protein [Arthrobacter saudimassiliensis]